LKSLDGSAYCQNDNLICFILRLIISVIVDFVQFEHEIVEEIFPDALEPDIITSKRAKRSRD